LHRTPLHRSLSIGLLLLAGCRFLLAANTPPENARTKELRALAGSWRPVSAENNGNWSSYEDLNGALWTRDAAGRWALWRGNKVIVEWFVQNIDPAQYPRTIDIEVTAGPYAGTVYLGIYELEGEKLRICFAMPDRPERPTDFTAAPGSGRALTEFVREEKQRSP
jgi:uncharacterized protein (TIGR03067 family)